MSVETIKKAVRSIEKLPAKRRAEVSGWVVNEVSKNTIHGRIKRGVELGVFTATALEGLREHAEGKSLKCLHP